MFTCLARNSHLKNLKFIELLRINKLRDQVFLKFIGNIFVNRHKMYSIYININIYAFRLSNVYILHKMITV